MSSAFPKRRFGRLLASFRERDFPRACYRGCSYFFMFRPHSLHASQIAPTATTKLAGQPRLVHPSRTCVVTFARIGYAIRPTTGNWRNEDFHLARFAALSAAHSSSKLFRTRQSGFSRLIRRIRSRTSRETPGRPGFPQRTFHVQKRRKPLRCQPITVSGLTMASAERQSPQTRERTAQKQRSTEVKRGRFFAPRCRTQIW